MEEIEKWTSKHKAEAQEYDPPIEEFQNRIMELKQGESQKRKVEEDSLKKKACSKGIMRKESEKQ